MAITEVKGVFFILCYVKCINCAYKMLHFSCHRCDNWCTPAIFMQHAIAGCAKSAYINYENKRRKKNKNISAVLPTLCLEINAMWMQQKEEASQLAIVTVDFAAICHIDGGVTTYTPTCV